LRETRIAIANASASAVEAILGAIASRPGIKVAWVASSGAEAVEKAAHDKPDLILMDLTLPVMDGLKATRAIMRQSPCAILIVMEGIERHAARVFEAMGAGAIDAESTPVIEADGTVKGAEKLLRKIVTVERLIGKEGASGKPDKSAAAAGPGAAPMIAIGSSTGGPKALAEIVSRLSVKPGAPIVIVQHVDEQFAGGLVSWLSRQTGLKVALARANTRPEPDIIWVAGTNDHLVVGADRAFHYVAEPRDNPYRPSVDVFFLSLLDHWPDKGVAVLLTGMGGDGARGLKALRKAGWHTIAQDEKTSVVYGMPKAAAELDAAVEILPIGQIGGAITRTIKSKEGLSL
jgi:two-component system response regulator WspF